ncbi:MAG TPA: hypothetical protein VFC99_05200, partial [Acidimicrobiia bacterium]|nr:hypothetical protein [Acidimicrobiia bacterium]
MRAPSVRLEERRGARTVAELAPYAALAVAVAVTFECLRVLFPAAYTYRERSGLTGTVVVVAAVFLAPVLALPLVRLLGRRAALVMGAVLLGAARLWLQHGGRITIGEAAVASALGLVTISIALVATADRSPRDGVVLALVAGLALDTVIRGAWSTWDPVWQSGAGPWAVAAALAAVLVAA